MRGAKEETSPLRDISSGLSVMNAGSPATRSLPLNKPLARVVAAKAQPSGRSSKLLSISPELGKETAIARETQRPSRVNEAKIFWRVASAFIAHLSRQPYSLPRPYIARGSSCLGCLMFFLAWRRGQRVKMAWRALDTEDSRVFLTRGFVFGWLGLIFIEAIAYNILIFSSL
jgi:hypothetical protein